MNSEGEVLAGEQNRETPTAEDSVLGPLVQDGVKEA